MKTKLDDCRSVLLRIGCRSRSVVSEESSEQ